MRELKSFESERIYWAVEQVERVAGDIDTLHLDDNLFYLKSEADKEIDFWKKESHDHYERWFSLNKQYEGWFGKVCRCERAERESRHQKYKRCLAMAEWCKAMCGHYLSYEELEWFWFRKWSERWIKIAEKFKETK